MFPNKEKMVKATKTILVMLFIAPVVYTLTAFLITYGNSGFGGDPAFIRILFLILTIVSATNISLTIFIQTSRRYMARRREHDPLFHAYNVTTLSAILAEAHSIYGLIITLLSGSMVYELGFSTVTWIMLLWIRARFTASLGSLPDQYLPAQT